MHTEIRMELLSSLHGENGTLSIAARIEASIESFPSPYETSMGYPHPFLISAHPLYRRHTFFLYQQKTQKIFENQYQTTIFPFIPL
jgi:hypothetical protein